MPFASGTPWSSIFFMTRSSVPLFEKSFTPELCQHTGPALVFDSYPEMKAKIDDLDLDVTKDTVLILRNDPHGLGLRRWWPRL